MAEHPTRENDESQRYEVIYVGHANDLSDIGLPFQHRDAARWIERAGSQWNLSVAFYTIRGLTPTHRERITEELLAVYHPSCNSERFQRTWKEEWIGSYDAPTTTKPLTTDRDSPPD